MNWTLGKVHRCFQKPSSYKDVRPDRLLQDDVVSDSPGIYHTVVLSFGSDLSHVFPQSISTSEKFKIPCLLFNKEANCPAAFGAFPRTCHHFIGLANT